MICRVWRGWTTSANAAAYEAIVRGEVIPEIEARRIPGFLSIDLMRRPTQDGVEFATIMWFDDIGAVKAFVGEDYDVAHVPERAAPSSRTSTNAQRTTRSSTVATKRHRERQAAVVGARVTRP
jgi:heme-degrading monooxygenase HmoA